MSLATSGSCRQKEGVTVLGQKQIKHDKERNEAQFNFVHSFLVPYLVCDVLLLCRGMTFGVNQSRVSDQVPSVLHDEAPAMRTHKFM